MSRYSSKTMNKEDVFSAWAPDKSLWSRWAKPVLFAHLDSTPLVPDTNNLQTATDASWSPPIAEKTALVLDLPGAEGVFVGVALAARGYRPVPLYNAVPLPSPESDACRMVAAVNVLPILGALRKTAEQLAAMDLPVDAPPAFLLDSNRQGCGRKMQANEFDNRSVCFTTDFPSGIFLLANGIERVLLVCATMGPPQTDLAHLLRRWQEAGICLERLGLDHPDQREAFEVQRPSWYGAMFQRVLSTFGLYRANTGGFGAWVPDSSAGG